MAIKQRALTKLNTLENHMRHAMETKDRATLSGLCRDLEEARNLYREGLPQHSYSAYGEVYDGLILATEKLMEEEEADAQKEILLLCRELLQCIITETEKERRFKKEMVFLPYKASMWDSLESIWRAAYEDREHCNAYVIPIPYADRNPDGSVKE